MSHFPSNLLPPSTIKTMAENVIVEHDTTCFQAKRQLNQTQRHYLQFFPENFAGLFAWPFKLITQKIKVSGIKINNTF